MEKVHAGERIVALDLPTRVEPPSAREIGLTPRESHVVALIAAGAANKEIARRLGLSMNTVKSHIRTAYRAMGVTSRTQAVLWAVEHGVTAPWVAVRDEVASKPEPWLERRRSWAGVTRRVSSGSRTVRPVRSRWASSGS